MPSRYESVGEKVIQGKLVWGEEPMRRSFRCTLSSRRRWRKGAQTPLWAGPIELVLVVQGNTNNNCMGPKTQPFLWRGQPNTPRHYTRTKKDNQIIATKSKSNKICAWSEKPHLIKGVGSESIKRWINSLYFNAAIISSNSLSSAHVILSSTFPNESINRIDDKVSLDMLKIVQLKQGNDIKEQNLNRPGK